MKVKIIQNECSGDGNCESICPEVFELGDDGLSYVINEDPDGELDAKIEEAVKECPTSAIIVEA